MEIKYTENKKRHILEAEGHVSTFQKDRVTKEQAELLFKAQLANEGITPIEQITVNNFEVVDPEN